MKEPLYLDEIIKFLGADLVTIYGDPGNIEIRHLKDAKNVDEFTLDWINPTRSDILQIAEDSKARAILVHEDFKHSSFLKGRNKVLLVVQNPKLVLAKIITEFFVLKLDSRVHPSAVIHDSAVIGNNANIGPNVIIGNCTIGKNVSIYGNTSIYDNVIIKDNVEIHNGVSIGSEAHNFIKDGGGRLIKFPHIGRVLIEDDVIIGANSVISRGVLEDTIIKKGCKIAQLVFIGANNVIDENCAIRPNVMTSGSVKIGRNTTIAPSVTIREHCAVGEDCVIGMGSVVTKNVPSGETWYGNPAKKK